MGARTESAAGPDPRPSVVEEDDAFRVMGARCTSCGRPSAFAVPRCPACRSEVLPEAFGPEGTVWSATTVRIPVPGRTPPYGLAYVDLDDGPRILAHVRDASAAAIGARVRLVGTDCDGDVEVEPYG
jgi:uncharacterized OB-fold protein